MPSHTACFHVLASCLEQALVMGKATTPYAPENDLQRRFLDGYFVPATGDLTGFAEGEFATTASWDAGEINAWLAEHGFAITLDPFTDPDDFGVAAVMKVRVEWETTGEPVKALVDDTEVDMALLTGGVEFTKTQGGVLVAHIRCKGGKEVVHICVAPDAEWDGLALADRVSALQNAPQAEVYGYGGIQFPQVDLDQEVDVSWFKDLAFRGTGRTGRSGTYRCAEAKQQTKFRMNHKGATAESAAAMAFCLESCSEPYPPLVIDKPFLVWITRDGQNVPYFAGYIDRDAWKAPAAL